MIKKFITLTTAIAIISTLMFPTSLQAITAEDRLIEVERQLQAIADQISKYEGDKTDLEKAILENDQDLQQVNRELAEVQSRLQAAERELDAALANYDGTLDDLANVQQTIVQEQTKLGKIKNEISNVSDELFETQKLLVDADEKTTRSSCKSLYQWSC
jgi:peptidoglycan hydrolase CwlO-like protein